MSTAPGPPTEAAQVPVSKPDQVFGSCWSCRLISGGGLVLSGAYVFSAARRVLRQSAVPSMGAVAQLSFAACLVAWGIVVIADPVGKRERKT